MRNVMIILLILAIGLTSCKNNEHNSFALHAHSNFYVVNKKGEDLLNPKSQNIIDTSSIKIFFLIQGKKIEYFKYITAKNSSVIFDNTKGFSIIKPEFNQTRYSIRVFLNEQPSHKDTAYTYIQWNKDNIDTIRSIVSRGDNFLTSTMFAFNDSIWNWKTAPEQDYTYTIVK